MLFVAKAIERGEMECRQKTTTNTMFKVSRPVLGLLIWVGCVVSARGDIFIEERFAYEPGRLVDVSGTSWIVHEGDLPLLVDESEAVLLNQPDSVRGREDVHRLLPVEVDPITDNITKLFAGFTVEFTSLPTGSGARSTLGSFFAHFRSSDIDSAYARVGATLEGATPGNFRLAVSNGGWSVDRIAEYPLDLSLNVSYRVIMGFDLGTDRVTLWVDPEDENSDSITASDGFSYSSDPINSFALRQGYTGTTTSFGAFGVLSFDDLVIGTRFQDVLMIPEPSIWVLFGLGFGALRCSRRVNPN